MMQTTSTAISLCAGTYNIDVTDANGCTTNGAVSINSAPPLTISASFTNPVCSIGCNGSIDASLTAGGSPPYMWSIDGGTTFQPGAIFTGICQGTYSIMVVDGNGCMGLTQVILGTVINDGATITHATCGIDDGQIDLVPSGGTSPYSFSWTGPNSFSSTNQNISGLEQGTYSLVITDDSTCTGNYNYIISEVPNSGIAGNIATQDANCGDGSATLSFTMGTAPFIVGWSNGDSTVTINNLNAGAYTASVSDANGCSVALNATINNIGGVNCGQISGTIYRDVNSNCIHDGSDTEMANRIVTANPGNYIALTDTNGYYEFNIPYGTYNVNRTAISNYEPVCDPNGISVVTDAITPTVSGINFGDSIHILPDAQVLLYGGNVRPLLPTTHYLYLKNETVTPIASGQLYYVMDSNITFNYASPTPDLISGDTLIWNISNLITTGWSGGYYIFGIGPNLPLGDSVKQCAWFETVETEVTTVNNAKCLDQIITGSFDPNDKTAIPEGAIRLKDSTLEYLVRFQNTGTDTAFTVIITDTIGSHLDISTLDVQASSHSMTFQIVNNNTLIFTFNNILLPDSNVNEPLSHGMVSYTIKQSASNVVGDTIENTANIYFDFNDPVITNTAQTPIRAKVFEVAGSSTDPACEGECNGTVTVSPSGDEAPFMIIWDDPQASTDATVDSLCALTYTATVIDAEGDTIYYSVDVNDPTAMSISSSSVDDLNNNCQGSASVSVSGGTGSYSYLWDITAGSQTTATATGLCGGTYTCTVTDSVGCTVVETVTVLSTVSIDEEELEFLVAPNPFETDFRITVKGNSEPIEYSVLNVIGQEIKRTVSANNQIVMDLSDQQSGIYFVQLKQQHKILQTIKLVKH